MNISECKRCAISGVEAVSKNSVSASIKFARASSIVEPWLAMSNSGHRDTYPSSSRSMMAVSRFICSMTSSVVQELDRRTCLVHSEGMSSSEKAGEEGVGARGQSERAFRELAERFRYAIDPKEVERLWNEIGRMVFGE
jgi:L,D-peptidoglycan transpeptidase YkuD (ErfK/YbiS/YcfS/YnhG family)